MPVTKPLRSDRAQKQKRGGKPAPFWFIVSGVSLVDDSGQSLGDVDRGKAQTNARQGHDPRRGL